MKARPGVLVVDDEAFVRDSLSEILRQEGFAVSTARDAHEAIRKLGEESVETILTDLSMPAGDGLLLLGEARRRAVAIPIIVFTGVGTIADAVASMKAGAFDFLQKPVDPAALVLAVRRALEHYELLGEVRRLRDAVQAARGVRCLAGESGAMQRVRNLIAQVASTDATVLISGESGTGKELAAFEIHRASARSERALVRVSCAALSEDTLESELFGCRRGATAGVLADRSGKLADAEGGTLVLDEVSALRAAVQTKLLRVLESGEYQVVGDARARIADVRVIAITNEDLEARVKKGAFRSDLYYRLNIFPMTMPPLRRHKEDLPALVAQVLGQARSRHGAARPAGGAPDVTPEALDVLQSYDWPGNVRELSNVIERALIVGGEEKLGASLFRSILESALPVTTPSASDPYHLRSNLDAAEKVLVQKALARSEGKKKEAANLLGIDPRNLAYYLKKHRLTESSTRETDE